MNDGFLGIHSDGRSGVRRVLLQARVVVGILPSKITAPDLQINVPRTRQRERVQAGLPAMYGGMSQEGDLSIIAALQEHQGKPITHRVVPAKLQAAHVE